MCHFLARQCIIFYLNNIRKFIFESLEIALNIQMYWYLCLLVQVMMLIVFMEIVLNDCRIQFEVNILK